MRAAIALSVLLAGCATESDGAWPSLATRPGEIQPLVQRPEVSATAAETPTPLPANRDAAARLSSLERDIAALAARLTTQRATTARAIAAATGQAAGSEAAAAAEVERSRADRLTSQAADLRDRLDALAGDLARQLPSGGDTAALLARTGAAIERVEALR